MDTGSAIVRWSGRGSIVGLKSCVASVLSGEGLKSEARIVGSSLVVNCPDPLAVATAVDRTPGVAWVAVGFVGPVSGCSARLAKNYLKEGGSFKVLAESAVGPASDAAGEATSSILGSVRGVKVDDRRPRTVFRVAIDSRGSSVGVQLREGPGGTPTANDRASCYVSGGVHSAAVAWQALLSGFRVTLVHGKSSEEALRRVASLYVELVSRVGDRGVELEVVEGGTLEEALTKVALESQGSQFIGRRAGGPDAPKALVEATEAPLYLLSEAQFDGIGRSLGTRGVDEVAEWGRRGGKVTRTWHFSGRAATAADVIGGLRQRLRQS